MRQATRNIHGTAKIQRPDPPQETDDEPPDLDPLIVRGQSLIGSAPPVPRSRVTARNPIAARPDTCTAIRNEAAPGQRVRSKPGTHSWSSG